MIWANETDKIWDIGYLSGSFDLFHIGHLNVIVNARARCKSLIVGVLSDEAILHNKKRLPVIPLEHRIEIIAALKYVDEVDITTMELLNKVSAWHKYRFDAMFSGDDHVHSGWRHEEDDLKKLGAELVFFPYTQGISTTQLRKQFHKGAEE